MDLKLIVPPNYQEFIFKDYEFISSEINIIPENQISSELISDIEFLCTQPVSFLNLQEVTKNLKTIIDRLKSLIVLETFLEVEPLPINLYENTFGLDYLYSYDKYVTDLSNNVYNYFIKINNPIEFSIKLNIPQEIITLLSDSFPQNTPVISITSTDGPIFYNNRSSIDITIFDLVVSGGEFKNLELLNTLISKEYTFNYEVFEPIKQFLNYNNYDITKIVKPKPITIMFVLDTIKNHLTEIKLKYNAEVKAVGSLFNVHCFSDDSSNVYGLERGNWQTQNVNVVPTITDYTVEIINPDINSSWVTNQLSLTRNTLVLISDNKLTMRSGISNGEVINSLLINNIIGQGVKYLHVDVHPDLKGILTESTFNKPLYFNDTLSIGNVTLNYKIATELTEEEYNTYKIETDPSYTEAITYVAVFDNMTKYNAAYLNDFTYQPIFEYITIDKPDNLDKIPQDVFNTVVNYTSRGFKDYDIETSAEANAITLKTIAAEGRTKQITRYSFERTNANYSLPKYFKGSLTVNIQDPRYHIAPSTFNYDRNYGTYYPDPIFTNIFQIQRIPPEHITQEILTEAGCSLTVEEYKALGDNNTSEGIYIMGNYNLDKALVMFSHIFNPVKIEDMFVTSMFNEIVLPYSRRNNYNYFSSFPVEGVTLNYGKTVLPYVLNIQLNQKIRANVSMAIA